ncbi:hypothetical protein BpHYR1_015429 [Brachionus plicatilis]|uniref:Uncharacterized protein n=1 Tax=Brachionus plicatilis TaxID=10195 RepID=A0A3M7QRK0_BRAPC|nr:hypothetical protein BpHYR1_015429 [Brachionus plicatilis]
MFNGNLKNLFKKVKFNLRFGLVEKKFTKNFNSNERSIHGFCFRIKYRKIIHKIYQVNITL